MKTLEVIIIGGGQAGLVMAYYLSTLKISYMIFEKGKIAQSWRDRYDSLQLITPKRYSTLPGLAFQKSVDTFPSKNDVIDYLEAYAKTIKASIKENCTVLRVKKGLTTRFSIETTDGIYEANQVVVASGYLQTPAIPVFSHKIEGIFQIHSNEYKNAKQVPKGVTLVVGAGNTGISIAKELATDRKVYLSQGKIKRFPRSILGKDIFWWAEKCGLFRLTTKSKLGKKISKKMIASGDATYGLFPEEIAQTYKIQLTERILDAKGTEIISKDGKRLTDVEVIIWATGFKPDYANWIHFDIFDIKGIPIHHRGITAVPGLFFLGLKWQYTISSFLLHGVGKDAEYIASKIYELYSKDVSRKAKYYLTGDY